MEFLKLVRRRSFLSELVYTVLNVGLAIAVLLTVRYTGSVTFAILLVVVSKWRVFAVRPRYWWANFQSNLVDFIVSVSVVVHMYTVNAASISDGLKLGLLVGVTLMYIAWLLFIKPRSKRVFMVLQAAAAIFLGVSALFTISYNWPVSVVVLLVWLIGFTAARHVFSAYDNETHSLLLSLVWGLILAEISWVAYHWAIAYPLPGVSSLMLSQAALIMTLVSFLAYKCYDSFYHHSKIRTADVLMPILFTVSIIAVLLIVFNRVGTAI